MRGIVPPKPGRCLPLFGKLLAELAGTSLASAGHCGHHAVKMTREFQIFAKPAGAVCNLDCQYCYYRDKSSLYPEAGAARMPDSLLEEYIVQHLEAAGGPEVCFSWHGGEPATLGVDFFRKAVELQRKHKPSGWRIRNGIQTNGVLLDDEWGRFLAAEAFSIGLSLDGPVYDLRRRLK